MLAERKRQILQAPGRRPWVCFLLRVVDNGRSTDWRDTDLAKEFLNAIFHEVACHDPNPHLDCKSDDFRPYFDEYGVARTSFSTLKESDTAMTVIAESENYIVAAAVHGWIFLLPLPSNSARPIDLTKLVPIAAASILKHKKRNSIYLPPWLSRFEFAKERALKEEIANAESRINALQSQLAVWSDYKGLLSTKGDLFVKIVIDVVRDFFGITIESNENYVEDAIVFENGAPTFVLEIKGVTAGIKREYINQVDSHRERLNFESRVAGMLIVNDFMNVDGLEERRGKPIDAQLLAHAERLNVKVLRAITLFDMMAVLECEEISSRREYFLRRLRKAKPLVTIE
jgi:hypothetical protein